jgi:hypothetical protein
MSETSAIETGLRKALFKIKKELDQGNVSKDTMEKAEIWSEMLKLQQEIDHNESNN